MTNKDIEHYFIGRKLTGLKLDKLAEQDKYICGYARDLKSYGKKIMGLCALTERWKFCPNAEIKCRLYLLNKGEEI